MKPVDQPDTIIFTAEDCLPLPVIRTQTEDGDPVLVTAWELTTEEMVEIQQTGRIWLQIRGEHHPPVVITVESPFKEP